MSRVFVKEFTDDPRWDVLEALEWLDWTKLVPSGARVFIKPNLTWKVHMPGVTTSPEVIRAVVQALLTRTDNIIVGESDGGYHTFDAEEAFHSHGLYDLEREYGIGVVNLSDIDREIASTQVLGKQVSVELPSLLLRDIDLFVTVPVPKVHVMTKVSLGFKNQWGCMPDTMRLRNHAQFPQKVLAINKLVNARLAIFDGGHVLDRTGPTVGEPVPMNLLLVSDDVGAGSLAWCEIMNIDAMKVKHLVAARDEGMFPRTISEVDMNRSLKEFQYHTFRLERRLVTWITLAAFNSKLLTTILYDSPLAAPLHNFVYYIRKNRLIARLLYGKAGPPPVEGTRHGAEVSGGEED